MRVQCHSTSYSPSDLVSYNSPDLDLTCSSGSFVDSSSSTVDPTTLGCTAKQYPEIQKFDNENCATEGLNGHNLSSTDQFRAKIGWNLDGTFHSQIELCQDKGHYNTLWTKHSIVGAAIGQRVSSSSPDFRRDVNPSDTRFYWSFSSQTAVRK